MFVYIFIFFYQYFKNSNVPIFTNYSFWVVTGILIYLGSTFFFNILADEIAPEQIESIWDLTFFGDIIKNILIAVAIIIYVKYPPRETPNQKSSSVPYLDMV